MAFDGIVIAGLTRELSDSLTGGKIAKIAQTEKDELLFTIKNNRETYRLLLSVNASLPLAYLTDTNKQGPMTAPNFCMLLRKHIGSGRIVSITQPGLERCIHLEIEHLDEMGDLCRKLLIVELMGKHSNIIFCTQDGMILDSIKHISQQVSSVREVLPGRTYFLPQTVQKLDPLTAQENDFSTVLAASSASAGKAVYTGFTGISPVMAEEFCHLASIDADRPASSLTELERIHLSHTIFLAMESIRQGRFNPCIVYRGQEPIEFSALLLTGFPADCRVESFDSISHVLETYYATRSVITRIRQKSSDLRRIVQTALERNYKKYDLQQKQMEDTKKRDKYKVWGELLNTYGYELFGGEKEYTCQDFYTGEAVRIPLDPQLTARENARKYFDKYSKLKRTSEALSQLLVETRQEIEHLESINTSLDIALKEEDLVQIKQELAEYGFIKKHGPSGKKARITSRPFHYLSSDGFHIYVGKNNYQNEELTFKFATGNDWWFHAKGIPGSHVIVKSEGKELPDRVFEEAASLAAYYSKGRSSEKTEIDYIQKKHVKKVAGAAPGFVIYHTNYSMMATPEIPVKEIL
ncbi:MAG: Rqc2 family fibronectin-binding protein [Clostridium sp.]|jgi:predicted ribosome quality control (RQC) complex YloA/Tae2 family protein